MTQEATKADPASLTVATPGVPDGAPADGETAAWLRPLDPIFSSQLLADRTSFFDSRVEGFIAESTLLDRERVELLETLRAIGERLPDEQRSVYHLRLTEIPDQIALRRRLALAIATGYDHYTIPGNFLVGFVEKPDRSRLRRVGLSVADALVFNAPIPGAAMKKYLDARDSELFDEIVVASIDRTLFRDLRGNPVPPQSMYKDPFLVGLVGAPQMFGRTLQVGPRGTNIQGAVGFLIAQWDLGREGAGR